MISKRIGTAAALVFYAFIFFTSNAQNFPSVFDPNFLNGKNGFIVKGLHSGDRLGFEVVLIGDINNDGLEDMCIEAQDVKSNNLQLAGTAYIIFGSTSVFPSPFDLATLNGTNGFKVEGIIEDERRGKSIGKIGDVNADGIDDVAIGTELDKQIILYGKNGAFPSSITTSTINGTNGFIIAISYMHELKGAGDFNGDDIQDIVMANYWSGETYILFGKNGNFPTTITDTWFDGTKGFRLSAIDGTFSAFFADGVGDVNKDGYDDVIVGIWLSSNVPSQKTYVYFGKPGVVSPVVNLKSVNGTDGFAINNYTTDPVKFLAWVGPLGDINGDGTDDFFSHTNIIYGSTNAFPAVVDIVAAPNVSKGFQIPDLYKMCSPAGDLNLDGIDDFIFVSKDDVNWVVYGSANGFSTTLDLTTMNNTKGFKIENLSQSNEGRLISGGGDVNGDGLSDFMIGSEGTDIAGTVYVVFGGDHYAKPLTTGYPIATNITASGFTLNVNAQEKGKIHYVVHYDSWNQNIVSNQSQILSGIDGVQHGEFSVGQTATDITKILSGLNPNGVYDVFLFLEDEAGSIGQIYKLNNVTMLTDSQAPVITCPTDKTLNCGLLSNYVSTISVSDDADMTPTVTQSPAPGTAIRSGMVVTMTATDNYDNTSTCTFTILVSNTIDCPVNKTLALGSALPDYTMNAPITGFCNVVPDISQMPAPGTSVANNMTVTLTATAGSITATCSFAIAANNTTTPIEESTDNTNLIVYPNPAKDIVHVKGYNYDSYEIIDNLGSIVLQGGSDPEINVSSISHGMYVILFYDSDHEIIVMKKIIKN